MLTDKRKEKISQTTKYNHDLFANGFRLGHASKAGSIGGISKSESNHRACRQNQAKSAELIRGSVWMHHPEFINRKRVKRNLVDEYKQQGYIVGMGE